MPSRSREKEIFRIVKDELLIVETVKSVLS
jgi:hypothetical protein